MRRISESHRANLILFLSIVFSLIAFLVAGIFIGRQTLTDKRKFCYDSGLTVGAAIQRVDVANTMGTPDDQDDHFIPLKTDTDIVARGAPAECRG